MGDRPLKRVRISEWFGLVLNSDPHDLQPGAAQVQINMQCLTRGKLTVRGGLQVMSDYLPATPGSLALISVFVYQHPAGDFVITVDAGGVVKARKPGVDYTLLTDANLGAAAPWSFITTRNGELLGTNGFRNLWWNGQLSAAEQPIGMREPSSSDTFTTGVTTGGAATAGDYLLAYRYVRATKGVDYIVGSLSATSPETATANQAFTASVTPASISGNARPTHVELWRTTQLGGTNVFYFIERVAFTGEGNAHNFSTDTNSDDTLLANAEADISKRLVIKNGREIIARAHDEPPNWAGKIFKFQDRAHYCVFVPYETGTLSVSSGSAAVTGSGTAWTNRLVGRYLYIDGETEAHTITAVGSTTGLTMGENSGANYSGASYAIVPNSKWNNSVFFSLSDEPESVDDLNLVTIQENTHDNDQMTNAVPGGGAAYIFFERHCYSYTFIRQPKIDADPRLIAARGCVSNQAAIFHEGAFYSVDHLGPYRMSPGGEVEPIAEALAPIFRDATLDWENRKWWFVSVDQRYGLVKFHVGYAADNSTRPKRAIVYNTRTGAWWEERYAVELGGAAYLEIDGRIETLYGGYFDQTLLSNAGNTDGVAAEVAATVTSSTTTVITCSAASFATSGQGLKGSPVAVISGTGKYQISTVTSNTGTALTVSPALTTEPVAGDVVLVGGIIYRWKSGVFRWAEVDTAGKRAGMENTRQFELLFDPCAASTNSTLDLRLYDNRASSPTDFGVSVGSASGDGFATTPGDPDAVGDLSVTDGRLQLGVSGQRPSGLDGKIRVEVEFRGFQGDDAVAIDQFILDGAE